MSKPVLLDDPLISPGCYSMDAYCRYSNERHGFREFPHQFIGRTDADVKRQAKKRGWVFHPDGTATCPKCVEDLKNG